MTPPSQRSTSDRANRPIAAIDIGSTSIRLAIAQLRGNSLHTLENLNQSVALGKDTFTQGHIRPESIEESVHVLKSFRRILDEYGMDHPDQVRAVATTAVREASNCDAFVDRVYMATGLTVEVLDAADMTRLTYFSVRPHIREDASLARSNVLIVEVGGGTTEILLLSRGDVTLSRTFHLGSLRLREMLDSFRSPVGQHRHLMENAIQGTLDQLRAIMPSRKRLNMIILGGDARFAAERLLHARSTSNRLYRLPRPALERLTDSLLKLSVEEIERFQKLPLAEAETLGPALLTYSSLARALRLGHVCVSNATMRHGLLLEMTHSGPDIRDFEEKIVGSAIETGNKYHIDLQHARQVSQLSLQLFEHLMDEHRLRPRHKLLLQVAAILHDAGLFISANSHHKHSAYLIQNSEIFGLNQRDIGLIALVARYHRKAPPRPTHAEFLALSREDRLAVLQLAAILRTADALDVAHSARIGALDVKREPGHLIVIATGTDDVSLEEVALLRKGPMFEEVFGLKIRLHGERP